MNSVKIPVGRLETVDENPVIIRAYVSINLTSVVTHVCVNFVSEVVVVQVAFVSEKQAINGPKDGGVVCKNARIRHRAVTERERVNNWLIYVGYIVEPKKVRLSTLKTY
jgi:hypothetical protein